MSKRQSDYLSSLLGTSETETAPPLAPKPSSMTLLARESALGRVASGDVAQITQVKLDPKRVRVWAGNARHQADLNEDNCRDLIDAIISEGGQKVPAIVRRVSNSADYDYEVIAGTRRLWAIGWLRANHYPDMMFLAQVHALDDEAAFRLSDIENRARKDVSDFERARTYLAAIDQHYGGKQARMAERLRLSKGWLSKMLSVAALPDWIVAAFASLGDIQLKSAYPLAQKISNSDEGALCKLKEVAAHLYQEQKRQKEAGLPSLPAADVIARLMSADQEVRENVDHLSLKAKNGMTAVSVMSANRNGIVLRLHPKTGASEDELIDLLRQTLTSLNEQGKGLSTS